MKDNLNVFESPKETAEAFGDYLISRILDSKRFHCALSGGSTPKLLFQYLAERYKHSDAWERLHVYWGDERCVPPDDEESNYRMTDELLLTKVPIPQANIHRVRGEAEPESEAERYGEELKHSLGKDFVFDLIILGMGEDGHTASIFPSQMELLKGKQACAVATHPTSGQRRVTLTGTVINAAREVVFLVTGAGKKEKLSEIFNKTGSWRDYPASYIQPVHGDLHWYVDKAASG